MEKILWGNPLGHHHQGLHSIQFASEGAGFKSPAQSFLRADGNRRPVSAKATNRGDLIVSLCHMDGNEGSPYRQTDLMIVSPRERMGGGL